MKTHRKSTKPADEEEVLQRELESLNAETEKLKAEVESLKAELEAQKDRYLRLAADFDNFRKRTAKETGRRAAEQKETFIRGLLPVIDNLERALASGESASPEQLREGVQMTFHQIQQLLRRHGIEPEEGAGEPFDPRRQEAIAARQDPSQPDQSVLEVRQRGYRHGDEVLRPARVVVNDLSHTETKAPAAVT